MKSASRTSPGESPPTASASVRVPAFVTGVIGRLSVDDPTLAAAFRIFVDQREALRAALLAHLPWVPLGANGGGAGTSGSAPLVVPPLASVPDLALTLMALDDVPVTERGALAFLLGLPVRDGAVDAEALPTFAGTPFPVGQEIAGRRVLSWDATWVLTVRLLDAGTLLYSVMDRVVVRDLEAHGVAPVGRRLSGLFDGPVC